MAKRFIINMLYSGGRNKSKSLNMKSLIIKKVANKVFYS